MIDALAAVLPLLPEAVRKELIPIYDEVWDQLKRMCPPPLPPASHLQLAALVIWLTREVLKRRE